MSNMDLDVETNSLNKQYFLFVFSLLAISYPNDSKGLYSS